MDTSRPELEAATLTTPIRTVRLPHDRNPALVYIGRMGSGSRRTMSEALNTIAGMLTAGRANGAALDWPAVHYHHVAAIRQALAERYSPATANKMLCALRGVLREAWRLGYLNADEYQRAADVPGIKAETLPRGRALAGGELRTLFEGCATGNSAAGARDAALLAILYGAGLRRAEAVNLTMQDYAPETGALTVRSGKGRKDRVCYATNGSREALNAWLAMRGTESGALLCPVNKGGRVTVRKMTDQAVLYIMRRRGARAGVAAFSPHDLRRSFISDLLDAGADISTVQRLAGHAHVTTTTRYDRRGETTKRKAAELLHIPYAVPKRGDTTVKRSSNTPRA